MRYRRSRTALWRRGVDRILVLPRSGEGITSLTGTGIPIWEALEEQSNIETLAQDLSTQFDGRAAVIAHDVKRVLADLEARGIVDVLDR